MYFKHGCSDMRLAPYHKGDELNHGHIYIACMVKPPHYPPPRRTGPPLDYPSRASTPFEISSGNGGGGGSLTMMGCAGINA